MAEQPVDKASPRVTIRKCPCGDSVCTTYGLSDGLFHQGTGWNKERAQQYADAINQSAAFAALEKAATNLLNGLPVFPETDDPKTQLGAHYMGLLTVGDINAARAALKAVEEARKGEGK